MWLYTSDPTAQYSYIKAAEEKGYTVLEMTGQLDPHVVGMLESKLDKVTFVRVDADIPERLIRKGDSQEAGLTPLQNDIATTLFRSQIPDLEKAQFIVSFDALSGNDAPATVTQAEFMRRMKEMASMQPGMSFYGDMPYSYTLMVNTSQNVVKGIIDSATAALEKEV